MALRIPWDMHEAVLLLDTYEMIADGQIARKDAIRDLSLSLRRKARLSGIEIDEVYRNENGISLQLNNMIYAATNGEQGLPCSTKLFFDVVRLKREQVQEYERILMEAKQMVGQTEKIDTEFWNWLAKRIQRNDLLSELYLVFPEVESYALKKGVLKNKLFETTDLSILSSVKEMVDTDKVFRFTHRRHLTKMTIGLKHYIDFIKENTDRFPAITNENQPMTNAVTDGAGEAKEDAVPQTETQTKICRVQFEVDEKYAHSTPISLTYFGDEYSTISWSDLYGQACKCLCEDYPDEFERLIGSPVSNGYRVEVGTSEHAKHMTRPKAISDHIFVECDFGSTSLIKRLKRLMDICSVDYENMEIKYSRQEDTKPEGESSAEKHTNSSDADQEDPIKVNRVPFIEWMRKQGVSTGVVFETLSSLNACSKIANEIGITNANLLLIQDCTRISEIKDQLLNNPAFSYRNRKQNNRYLVALSRYYDFRSSHAHTSSIKEKKDDSPTEGTWKILDFLNDRRLEYIDNTSKGGSLWIIGGRELKPTIDEIQTHGITFHFRAYGGNASSGRPAWWAKLPVNQPASAPTRPHSTGETIVNDERNSRYELILRECFENGFRPGSAVDKGRFKNFYQERYGEEVPDSIERVVGVLERLGANRDGRIYAKQGENGSHILDEITQEIISAFEAGASCVYVEAVYERYQQRLSEEVQIYNPDALKDAIMARANGAFYSRYSYLGCFKRQPDVGSDVLSFMSTSSTPISYDEIKEKLWYLPFDRIKNILVTTKSIVAVATGCYFYAPNLPISISEKQTLIELIGAELDLRGHITEGDLFELINSKCTSIAINTEGFTNLGVRNALGFILRDHFTFNGPIISKHGTDLSVGEVYAQYCRNHETLDVDDLKELASEINLPIRWEVVLEEMVRISESELVRKDLIAFDVDSVDSILEQICTSDYYAIKKVDLFLHFPPMDVKWTDYLLESFVYCYSKKFALLHASFSATACCGAIVRRQAGIESYHDLLIRVLSESDEWKDKKTALEYIVREGYQQRRIYSDIDNVLHDARIRKEHLEKQKRG